MEKPLWDFDCLFQVMTLYTKGKMLMISFLMNIMIEYLLADLTALSHHNYSEYMDQTFTLILNFPISEINFKITKISERYLSLKVFFRNN